MSDNNTTAAITSIADIAKAIKAPAQRKVTAPPSPNSKAAKATSKGKKAEAKTADAKPVPAAQVLEAPTKTGKATLTKNGNVRRQHVSLSGVARTKIAEGMNRAELFAYMDSEHGLGLERKWYIGWWFNEAKRNSRLTCECSGFVKPKAAKPTAAKGK